MNRRSFLLGVMVLTLSSQAEYSTASETVRSVSLGDPTAPDYSRWYDKNGAALPFASDEAVEEFLRNAKVSERKTLGRGINKADRYDLEWNGVRARAIFRTVDKKRKGIRLDGKMYRDFHDAHVYECGAYRLSRLIGILNVPPCVFRSLDAKKGTLQLWVENAMTENEHRNSPERGRTAEQRVPEAFATMRLFDALIDNFDRHMGNVLIDERERIWFIDHTRSFRLYTDAELGRITGCPERVYERLKSLTRKQISRSLGSSIEFRRIDAVDRRRKQILMYLNQLIAERGKQAILFSDTRPHSTGPDN